MDVRRKKLRVRAWRRGTRELDLIFGNLIDHRLDQMTDVQMSQIEALLEAQDLDVYDWIIGRAPVPAEHDHEMMAELQDFSRLSTKLQTGQ
ncbi:MAG: succinate dehydrogenase assembly factor 2 [Robiginitomaculum sp.]|nr:MAG: succinate dehydrogenase assembly factor 2 [Robiginitomaculum sp.]